MGIREDLQHYSNTLLEMKNNEAQAMALISPGDDPDPLNYYFQISLMFEVSSAVKRLLESEAICIFFGCDVGRLKINTLSSIILNTFNATKENYQNNKNNAKYFNYALIALSMITSLYALYCLAAAVMAMQFTIYCILCGVLLLHSLVRGLRILRQIEQMEKDFSLLEQVQKESESNSNIHFSAKFENTSGETFSCKLSTYQLAQAFFTPEIGKRAVAKEAFEQFQQTYKR